MNKSIFKKNPILNSINNSLIKLPTPLNVSMWWNFGSLLGLTLMLQILSGLFLSMHYSPNIDKAFFSIIHIIQDVNKGWLFRLLHLNGASMFFFFLFFHIGRNMYYGSYKLVKVWNLGIMILLISMMTAFLGYVLPWGQMSFWGATVITNLISTFPYIGTFLVNWIWGGFTVNEPTLNRFFSLHFILPFIMIILIIMHLWYLHESGSSNPLGIKSNMKKIPFNIYFSLKDLFGFMLYIYMFMFFMLIKPYMFSDPENFIQANSMNTPTHIQPEWYFLFAYSILRCIPNKLGGVIALIMSILILFLLPLLNLNKFQSLKFYPINQILFYLFINIFILLTWLGSKSVEPPFIKLNQYLTFMYFSWFYLNSIFMWIWNKILL